MSDISIPLEFVTKFLASAGVDHDDADGSVGDTADTWYADSETLARMCSAYLTNQLQNLANAGFITVPNPSRL